MSESEEQRIPEVGEIVIATVNRITDYGAYVSLDEYGGIEGFLHISEVSSSWVRNIKDYVRPREKLVLKVLRVDEARGQIDLSLRRVSGKEKQEKLVWWKREKKAESVFETVGEKLRVEDPKSFAAEMMARFREKFPSAYAGLEELVEKGESATSKLEVEDRVVKALLEVARQKIKIPTVKIKGFFQLTCPDPKGVEAIKDSLVSCRSAKRFRKVKIETYTVGAPRYAVEVTARSWKDAEKALQELVNCVLARIKSYSGEGSFKRET